MPDPEPSCTLLVEADAWQAYACILAEQAEEVCVHTQALLPEVKERPQFTLILCDDDYIRTLNAQWRKKSKATNVLSFPTAPLPEEFAHLKSSLGDVFLAFETSSREAEMLEIPIVEHATHLILHGLLHLLGYDHQTDDERKTMEGLEIALLTHFNYDNPYNTLPMAESA